MVKGGHLTWADVLTNSQRKRIVDAVAREIGKLKRSPKLSDILEELTLGINEDPSLRFKIQSNGELLRYNYHLTNDQVKVVKDKELREAIIDFQIEPGDITMLIEKLER